MERAPNLKSAITRRGEPIRWQRAITRTDKPAAPVASAIAIAVRRTGGSPLLPCPNESNASPFAPQHTMLVWRQLWETTAYLIPHI